MYYKYPRTPHLPFSEGATSDDKMLKNTKHFIGKEIVITEKMDGENSTIYKDYYHARSLSSAHKEYHSWLLSFIQTIQWIIPDNVRICGEYMFAKHSIGYDNLKSYFLAFSVWNKETCLSWDDTIKFCGERNLGIVPELYRGTFNEEIVKQIAKEVVEKGGEGIVIRFTDEFQYKDFGNSVAKYVRKNHVQTDKHWSVGKIERNKLEE